MSEIPPPTVRRTLVFAASDAPLITGLLTALAEAAIEATPVDQVSRGLALLCRRPAGVPPPSLVVILGNLSGLPPATIARTVRSLPGLAGVPLLVVGDMPMGLARCVALAPPADVAAILRLILLDPGSWPSPAEARTPPPPARDGCGREVVLVVDDNEINRRLISGQIRGCGLAVETCGDGQAALARIAAGGVALVLLDCQMPVMDGYEAIREIRRREAGSGRHLPIIAVTAHAMADNRDRCLGMGMDDFLTKPLTQERLSAALQRWLPSAMPARTVDAITGSPPIHDAVFDPGTLLRIDQQMPGTAQEILAIMDKELPIVFQELPRLTIAGDWAALTRAAHKLKGTSLGIGASELARACADLERLGRADDADGCRAATTVVQLAISRLQERLAGSPVSPPVA